MRIGLFHNLPSGGAKRGLNGFVRELAKRGHFLHEITLSTADLNFLPLTDAVDQQTVFDFSPLLRSGLRVPGFNSFVDALTSYRSLERLDQLYRQVALWVDGQHFDAVLVNDCIVSLKPSLLRYLNTPTIFYCHHSVSGLNHFKSVSQANIAYRSAPAAVRSRIYRLGWHAYWAHFTLNERRSIQAAQRVVTNSRFTTDALFRDFNVEANVSPYGTDTAVFRPQGAPKDDYVITVGELAYRKGLRFLVESLGQIPITMRPRLLIVANAIQTDERRVVEGMAERLQVTIDIRSVRCDDELCRLYNRSLLFLYSPIKEAFGLAPVEAMACGVPVVAVAEGGVPESVLHGITGILTERDSRAFADAIQALLKDSELRSKLAENAHRHVIENWSWDRAGSQLEAYILQTAKVSNDTTATT